MFIHYYGLREQPFGVTPDPRFIYLGPSHQKAYSSLLYGIENRRGFMALVAPPGLGKTTVLLRLLEEVQRTDRTAFVFHANPTPVQLLRSVIADLGTEPLGHDPADLQRQFGDLLYRISQSGKRVVLAIDEAQNLTDEVLETIRMLSNFETHQAKLVQIIMAGQPHLANTLSSPRLEQLRQRLAVVARCLPFADIDVPKYIYHRLRVAGYKGAAIFTPEAVQLIATHSKGVPRTINNLCFQALSLGCAQDEKCIKVETVQEAISELSLEAFGMWPAEALETETQAAASGSPTKPPVRGTSSPKPLPTDREPAALEVSGPVITLGEDNTKLGMGAPIHRGSSTDLLANESLPIAAETTSTVSAGGVIADLSSESPIPWESPSDPVASRSAPVAQEAASPVDRLEKLIADSRSLESLKTAPPGARDSKRYQSNASGSLAEPPIRRGVSPNPYATRSRPDIREVQPSEGVAGPSPNFSWAKHQSTVLGGDIPEPRQIPPPVSQKSRPVSFVLFGLVALFAGVAASPWIKSGFVSSDRRSVESRTSPVAESLATPVPVPAGPVTATPTPAPADANVRSAPRDLVESRPSLAKRSIRTGRSTAGASLMAAATASAPVAAPSSAAPATKPDLVPPPGRVTTHADGGIRIVGATEAAGRLGVQSNITGARVSIDGQTDFAWTTPYVFSLSPGVHSVVVSGPDGGSWRKTVRVEAGQDEWIVANLEDHETAHLALDTDPPDLQIVVDGKAYGTGHVDVLLSPGWHECQVIPGPGLRPVVERFQLKPGEVLTKRIVLSAPASPPGTGNGQDESRPARW